MDVRRTKIQFIRYAVDTGERPILCTGVDNRLYWCKNFDESTNGETIVNELVSYEVGRAIDAPVPSWTIMDPGDYAGELVHSENGSPLTVVSRKPLFGSQHIHGTVASEIFRCYISLSVNIPYIQLIMGIGLVVRKEAEIL